MTEPGKRRPADINDEIQSLRGDIDKLSKKQDISNIVQTQSWWIAIGFAWLSIAVAFVLGGGLDANKAFAVLFLLVIGGVAVTRSRQLASIVWKWELGQKEFKLNQVQRRLNMPPIAKTLAAAAALVLFILGCLYLAAGFVYIVLSSFSLFSLTLSAIIAAAFFGLGIVHLVLSFLVIGIRRDIE